MGLNRIEQARIESGLVAQEQQTLGIRIEPSEGVHPRRKPELSQGTVGRSIRSELGQHAIGLVEGQEHRHQ